MEARPRRTGWVALGVVVIIASALWTLLWGMVGLLASAFGGDTNGWVIVSVSLAIGVFVFVLGLSLVRGRRPNTWGWVAAAAAALATFALPINSWSDDRNAAPLNRAAERAFLKLNGQSVEADCNVVFTKPDGSELGECIFENDAVYDICDVHITTQRSVKAVDIGDCLNGRR